MAQITILYWRDIPAQIVAKAGRKKAKRQLPERFEKTIDAAAMRSGAKDTDAYLTQWRKGEPTPCGDDLDAEVEKLATSLDSDYPMERLRGLMENEGREA